MSPASESLVKKLVVFTSLVVLGSSIAFLLVACGASHSGAVAQRHSAGWRVLPAAPIRVDANLTSVWTGREMIVSGVKAGKDGTFVKSTEVAAAYDPATQTWRRLALPPMLEGPCRRDAVWTGKEMLVWGCFGQAAFDPATNHWRRLPEAPAGHGIEVWTGREMIGWGGGCCGDAWSGGAGYAPATDTWRELARSPLAPEQRPIGAWTGRELVLFVSGINPVEGKPWPTRFARAAAYDPATDTWRRIAPIPTLRREALAVWDGHEILVVGGTDARGAPAAVGLAYDPATNRWRRLAAMPSRPFGGAGVWTGTRLQLSNGLTYDPKADRWSDLPQAPLRTRNTPTAVWNGRTLLVWNGKTGATYTPERSSQ